MLAAPVLVTDRVYTGMKAIARRLGCSQRTVARIIARGELRTFKTGEKNSPHRCRRSVIDAYIAEREGRG